MNGWVGCWLVLVAAAACHFTSFTHQKPNKFSFFFLHFVSFPCCGLLCLLSLFSPLHSISFFIELPLKEKRRAKQMAPNPHATNKGKESGAQPKLSFLFNCCLRECSTVKIIDLINVWWKRKERLSWLGTQPITKHSVIWAARSMKEAINNSISFHSIKHNKRN